MDDGAPTTFSIREPSGLHLLDTTMFWSAHGGGVGRYLRSKHAWLAAHTNWRHTVLVPGSGAIGTAPLQAPWLPFSGGYRFPLNRGAAARRIVDLRPDVVEVGDPYRLAWSALDAAWDLGIPVTYFAHSNVAALGSRFLGGTAGVAVRRYLRRLYAQFDAVFAASQWMVGELSELGLANVVHQPLGVDTKLFAPRQRDPSWRNGLGLPADAVVLLYAGRYAAEKNLQVLTDAVERLGAPYVLVTIGDGPHPPQGRRVLRLPYAGDADVLARALASADLFVHAGDQETFGLAALEALACGTPVVARSRAGMTDLLDGHCAVGVDRGDLESYAECIAWLAPRAADLRAAARRRALRFDADRAFERLTCRYRLLRAAVTFGESDAREPYAA